MKLDALVAATFLATTAQAVGPNGPGEQRLTGEPEKLANWRWPNPFTSDAHKQFTPSCEATAKFDAEQYILEDLSEQEPIGLLAFRDALKEVFSTREYPGSWEGIDPHGYDRVLLQMAYDEIPLAVREWHEHQERTDGEGKGLFALYPRPAPGTRVMHTITIPKEVPVPEEWRERDNTRVLLFSPGAVYETLPLWVAEGSDCEATLRDLSLYTGELSDGGVVAYPVTHTTPNRKQKRRDIEIEIKAQVLKKNVEQGEAQKEEL
ncbi:uncharacterized protein C8A04DRAFT_40860 [Dichotomopilus funicola]|uniref:Uncharacterized protein n=1 Tax=Dichotomopilus funicola TaxID=1934379 RepID=A0AAN6UUP1_9PEZI|nr:hypothetical protein C8A04DRAFT_40860 [Dichotomopilus funicola]